MPQPFIMFDVEGTLVDCVPQTLQCWQRTFRAFGFEFSVPELHRHSGRDPDDMMRALLAPGDAERLSSSLKKEQGKRYREECLPKVQAFSGVRLLFEALAERGCQRALVTSCAKDELDHYMKLTGIAELVSLIACGEDVDHQKPHPDLIELAVRKSGRSPQSSFMIGDTPYDAQAARAAGTTPIGLLSGGFRKQELLKAGCSAVYRNPAHLTQELSAWIGSLIPAEP
jgi:HAD superfamily hydrolase (TIGR01549 family)